MKEMLVYDTLCDLLQPWTNEKALSFLCYDIMRVVNALGGGKYIDSERR